MFARFIPVFITLVAMIGATAASSDLEECTTACCENASLAPTGWQGSPCTYIAPNDACANTKLCCFVFTNTNIGMAAGKCTGPISN
ncbi:hypothetical protein HD554DRAFT_2174679 [Boletus coccyginus]|nr:hypothetical protein HD554DRAFT_2174679 [Boletus coccyginus]